MDGEHLAVAFLRHEGGILLTRNAGDDQDPDTLGTVTISTEDATADGIRDLIRERTGLAELQLVRAGEPFEVSSREFPGQHTRTEHVTVHPFLFDCETRAVRNARLPSHEWRMPTVLLRREDEPALWRAYDRVRPIVETIAEDTDHGSASLSITALEVLRDEAALVDSNHSSTFESVEAVALEILAARPSMTAVTNRINRAMTEAVETEGGTTVETAAHEGIERALDADSAAAANAAKRIDGKRIGTLSRSGTVLQTIELGTPAAVLVAESSPGREGIDVAEALAGERPGSDADKTDSVTDVTLTSDVAFPAQLAEWDADVLCVGADSVLADGRVVNKVGTRGAAIASNYEGIEVLVVTASDKISPDTSFDPELRGRDELYSGNAPVSTINPTFEATPATSIDCVVTERGVLDTEDVTDVASEHAKLTTWQ